MTQLPEAEILLGELDKELTGKKIKDIWVSDRSILHDPSTLPKFKKAASQGKVLETSRKGTCLIAKLEGDSSLVIVPGSRARVQRHTASAEHGENTRFVMSFTTGGSIHYLDKDTDGQFFVIKDENLDSIPALQNLGLDPLSEPIPWPVFSDELAARKDHLFNVLLDESLMVGIGEIYASEALFRAGLHPKRMSDKLSNQEVRRLHRSLVELIADAIKAGGIDMADPLDPDGFLELDQLEFLEVHGRDGLPDTRSRALIEAIDMGNGHTAYASSVQS